MKSLRCIQIFLPETERFEYPFRNNERSFKPHQLVIIFAYLVYTETNETKSVTKSLFISWSDLDLKELSTMKKMLGHTENDFTFFLSSA